MTTPDAKLNHVLRNWQEHSFNHKPTLVKAFTTGLNHSTYLVKSGNERMVLKIFARPLSKAIHAQQCAAELGLAPGLRFLRKQGDLMIMEFIDSPTLEPQRLTQEKLTQLGKAINHLHASTNDALQTKQGKFDLLQFCENYLQELDGQIRSIHTRLLPALNIFTNDPTPWTLCHNDLVKENCFLWQSQVIFIDWEYAQSHNPWFDLAAIIHYFNLSPEQAELFLDAYQNGWRKKVGTSIYYSSQCAVLWLDLLWHLTKMDMCDLSALEDKRVKLKQLARKLDLQIEL